MKAKAMRGANGRVQSVDLAATSSRVANGRPRPTQPMSAVQALKSSRARRQEMAVTVSTGVATLEPESKSDGGIA
jgi:hypothetical protein